MGNRIFSGLLFLFLLVPASITWAQKITQEKGLTTAVFNVSQGTIKIFVPDDIRLGDIISGTVTATADGRNEKQKERNIAELAKYAIVFNGQKFNFDPGSRSFRFLPSKVNSPECSLSLLFDKSSTPVQQLNIPPKPITEQKQTPAQCVIPGHVVTGAPMNVPGPFDGNANNTQCTIGNQSATTLVESPRNSVFSFPANANGMQPVSVQEDGKNPCTKNVSGVVLEVSAGKLNLVRRDNTFIDVNIKGLQNLEQTATLSIINLTTETVKLQPSNTIIIPLEPGAVSGGNFNQRFDVQSLRSGSFTCNVNLDFNNVMLSPGPDNQDKGKCNCSISVESVKRTTINPRHTYAVLINKSCGGDNCTEASLTKKWEIISGTQNGEIVDKSHDKSSVTVQPKGPGTYILMFTATLTCSDGSTCTATCYTNENGDLLQDKSSDPPPVPYEKDPPKIPTVDTSDKKPKECIRLISKEKSPQMNGGLKKEFRDKPITIARDGFVPLVAEGGDIDLLKVICAPVNPNCPGGPAELKFPVSGKVKFYWEIIKGEGQFVKLGCLYSTKLDQSKDSGEHVIFMPPYVDLPNPFTDAKADSLLTTVRLLILDAKNDGMVDDPVERIFQIKTKRIKETPHVYEIQFLYPYEDHKLPGPPSSKPAGPCIPSVGAWTKKTDLRAPIASLPDVPDNNKVVLGQWIVLKADDQKDTDILKPIICTGACPVPPPTEREFEDNILYTWSATAGSGGEFIGGNTGRYVIYKFPEKMETTKTELIVSFTVKASNSNGVQGPDDEATSKPVTVTVYHPGIRLHYPDPKWLPALNQTTIRSELVYKIKEEWKPGFAHMCRIQYFELFNISREEGVCLNDPLPEEADKCVDLQFPDPAEKDENKLIIEHELYNPVDYGKTDKSCDRKNQYMMAQTRKPEREYTIEVQSRDYGSFGFARSFANINNGMEWLNRKKEAVIEKGIVKTGVVYSSVPWLKKDEKHPLSTDELPRLKLNEYRDNRVTIPKDLDENHIADEGWLTIKGQADDPDSVFNMKQDPEKLRDAKRLGIDLPPANDNDDSPTGDGFHGDGLGSYEEYRGFMTAPKGIPQHVRTHPGFKDVFVCNENGFDLDLYRTASGLGAHEINKVQFVNTETRKINFNNSDSTHVIDQMGVYLREGKFHDKLLGIAIPIKGSMPSSPNHMKEVIIYSDKIDTVLDRLKIQGKRAVKIQATVAHELLHANNVCHHGEGNEAVENSHDLPYGLRSGNINCVMHYDNSGIKRDLNFLEEPIGSLLCTDRIGTGYNAPGNHARAAPKDSKYMWFGNALLGRGNCAGMIRISGRGEKPTDCGDRFGTDNKLKNPFKEKLPGE